MRWFVVAVAVGLVACGSKDREDVELGTEAPEANAEEVPLDPFTTDTMHTVEIEVDGNDLPTLDADRSVKVPCAITIDGVRFEGANIREKGSIGSSSNLDGKPGFNVQFGKRKRPKGLKKITFNNALQDPSLVHEHLAYEMYRRAGIPAPRTGHTALSLAGRDYGIYVVVEPIDKSFLEREFGNGDGNLYEGKGYDFIEGADNHEFLELKDEDEGRNREDIAQLASLARGASNESFAGDVGQKLDLDRYITAYALDGAMAHWDGPQYNNNNFYLYSNPGDGRLVLLPHGMDQVFDNTFDPMREPKPFIGRRIREIPELDARLRAEMNRIVQEVWDVAFLVARMHQVRAVIHAYQGGGDAVARDREKFDLTFEGMEVQLPSRPAQWSPL